MLPWHEQNGYAYKSLVFSMFPAPVAPNSVVILRRAAQVQRSHDEDVETWWKLGCFERLWRWSRNDRNFTNSKISRCFDGSVIVKIDVKLPFFGLQNRFGVWIPRPISLPRNLLFTRSVLKCFGLKLGVGPQGSSWLHPGTPRLRWIHQNGSVVHPDRFGKSAPRSVGKFAPRPLCQEQDWCDCSRTSKNGYQIREFGCKFTTLNRWKAESVRLLRLNDVEESIIHKWIKWLMFVGRLTVFLWHFCHRNVARTSEQHHQNSYRGWPWHESLACT